MEMMTACLIGYVMGLERSLNQWRMYAEESIQDNLIEQLENPDADLFKECLEALDLLTAHTKEGELT